MEKLLHDMIEGVLAFLTGLIPPALGACVSLIYEPGLTWAQRALQLLVGITVSYFVTRAASAVYPFHPYVNQALGFIIGMIAYRAAPGFISGSAAVAAELPTQLRDRLFALLPRRKDSK